MTTDNLKKINAILELKQMRHQGADMLKGREKADFQAIGDKFDDRRVATEQLYRGEYRTISLSWRLERILITMSP